MIGFTIWFRRGRFLGLFAMLLFSLTGLFSCGDSRTSSIKEPVEILVWDFGGVPGHREWIRRAVKKFNDSRDDIQVEIETPDWKTQRESLISTTIIGEGPDVIRVHHKYSVEFGELGGLLPLETFSDWPRIKERLFSNVLEHVRYKGKHYGLPITMLPFVLAANQSILDEYNIGIPRTWEDMMEVGRTLKQHNIHAFTMPAGLNLDTAYRFLPLLYGAGGRVFNEEWTKAGFNGPAGRAALKFLVDLKKAGYMPAASAAYAFDENAAHWTTGQAAFSIEGPWWQDIVRGDFNFDLSQLVLAPVPVPERTLEGHPSRTLLDVIMVAITAYTPHPNEAWTVLKAFNYDDPIWKVPDPQMGGLPTYHDAYGPNVKSRYINLDQLAAAGKNGIGWPGHPAITEIQRHISDAVNRAMTGVMLPQEALDHAAAQVNELLSDY